MRYFDYFKKQLDIRKINVTDDEALELGAKAYKGLLDRYKNHIPVAFTPEMSALEDMISRYYEDALYTERAFDTYREGVHEVGYVREMYGRACGKQGVVQLERSLNEELAYYKRRTNGKNDIERYNIISEVLLLIDCEKEIQSVFGEGHIELVLEFLGEHTSILEKSVEGYDTDEHSDYKPQEAAYYIDCSIQYRN